MRLLTVRAFLTSFLLALCSVVSGCATIVHLGGEQELNVTSEPSGAKVVIDGTERGVTPLAIKVERKKDHAMVFAKDGFQETQTKVESHISNWIAGNLVCCGLIGFLVDLVGSGGYTIEPDAVAVNLKPVEGVVASPAPSLSSLPQSPPIP